MYRPARRFGLPFLFMLSTGLLVAQEQEVDERALIEVKDGISIREDSIFLLNLRFRMQNRLGFTTVSGDDFSASAVDARVRRLRLRLDGFVLNDQLRYYIQLNFSRADLDQEAQDVAQVIRDAMVYYHFNEYAYIGFGQSKLPGNRQRVTSSGNLQFADRSIANAAYTLDRDFGIFGYWTIPIATQEVQLKAAMSSGDGRGALPINGGMAYTGRIEWLPLGPFTNKGDYSEGDLEFEPRPKVSFGAVYSWNESSARTGGQLGSDLYDYRSAGTFIADVMAKHNGWALSGEYFDRRCDDPITTNVSDAVRVVTVGTGANVELSKIFKSMYQLAGRYSLVVPADDIEAYRVRTEEVLLGSTKYLNDHRIKLQFYGGYRWIGSHMALDAPLNSWTALFQVEFGI